MIIDTTDIGKEELYQLLSSSILPRPIAWVGTIGKDGQPNLAPFSFFNVASIAPPVISVSILNKINGIKKDTLTNIEDTKVFSVSVVSRTLAEKMAITGIDYEPGINEFEIAGVSCVPCSKITSVRVGEAKVSLECRLHSITRFGDDEKAGNLILANVVAIHADDDILEWPRIDTESLDVVGRLSGSYYSTTKERFTLE